MTVERISDERRIDPGEKSEAQRFYELAESNQELFQSIKIVIPVRVTEGITRELSDLRAIWLMAGIESECHVDYGGGFIECTRAQIARLFLDTHRDKSFLLMIDSDMVPDVDLPWQLARHRESVVGCCAMGVNQSREPMLCFTRKDAEGEYRFPILSHGEPIPARGLAEVGHVGTGAICIRRDVLESFQFVPGDTPFYVREKIRQRGHSQGHLTRGEDIEFCSQVKRKGFKVYVDLEAHVGHQKPLVLRWEDSLRSEALSIDEWVLPAKGMKISHGD